MDPETIQALIQQFMQLGIDREQAEQLVESMAGQFSSEWSEDDTSDWLWEWLDYGQELQSLRKKEQIESFGLEEAKRQRRQRQERVSAQQSAVEIGLGRQQAEEAESALRLRKWYEENVPAKFGERPTFQQATEPSLQEMRGIPAMQRYFERELPSIYTLEGMPGKRRRWWEEKTKYVGLPFTQADIEAGNVDPTLFAEAERLADIERQEREGLTDPWLKFLSAQKLAFEEKWKGLTPQERGFKSGLFRPRAKFLG